MVEYHPDEDIDGDGFAAWEDCDDGDPALLEAGSGMALIALLSPHAIPYDGLSLGSGGIGLTLMGPS